MKAVVSFVAVLGLILTTITDCSSGNDFASTETIVTKKMKPHCFLKIVKLPRKNYWILCDIWRMQDYMILVSLPRAQDILLNLRKWLLEFGLGWTIPSLSQFFAALWMAGMESQLPTTPIGSHTKLFVGFNYSCATNARRFAVTPVVREMVNSMYLTRVVE